VQILIFPLGSRGDLHPFVGLGRQLARRGHEVTVAANDSFAAHVSQAGLGFASVGTRDELEQAFRSRRFWHPYHCYGAVIHKVIMPAMRRQLDVAARLHRPGRTVLVAGTASLGARIAHDALGVPLVSVHVQPMVVWSEYRSPVVGPLLMGDRVPRLLKRLQYRLAEKPTVNRWMLRRANLLREELRLEPLACMSDLLNSPQRVVGLFPAWYAPPQPDWPRQMELTGFALWDGAEIDDPPQELETFLAEGEPPIAFTISSTAWRAREFFEAAVGACRRLGRRGVLLTASREHLPATLPDGVRQFDYVPLAHLLPRVAAFVHHGGLGSAAQALAAGIPQLTRPACFDQPDNAERLRRLGVSETLSPRALNEASLTRALARLLGSESVRRRCAELADRVRKDPPLDSTCEIIESQVRVPVRPTKGKKRRNADARMAPS
jgi:UDP:flavonoid glycosyltransferase YjiC (YdhE family)